MKEWTDILKRLQNETSLPPVDDWEFFLSIYDRHIKKKRSRRLFLIFFSMIAAASVAIFIITTKTIAPDRTLEKIETAKTFSPTINHENKDLLVTTSPIHNTITTKTQEDNYKKDTINYENEEMSYFDKAEEHQKQNDRQTDFSPTTQDNTLLMSNYFEEQSSNNKINKIISITSYLRGNGSIKSTEYYQFSDHLMQAISNLFPEPINGAVFSIDGAHSIPVSFGIDVRVGLTSKIGLTSGIDLSRYRSRFNLGQTSVTQNAYYLGIPLRFDLTVWENGPVGAWIGGGGKVDRLVYGKLGPERIKDNALNWSIVGEFGAQYNLSDNIGIFLAPEVSYYFKPENPVLQTYRTENPLMFTVGIGLRFSL